MHLSLSCCLSLTVSQITVFRMGSEGHQDIDLAILTALLKGGCVHLCECAGAWMYSKWLPFHCRPPGVLLFGRFGTWGGWYRFGKHFPSLSQFSCMFKAHKYVCAFAAHSIGIKHRQLCLFFFSLKAPLSDFWIPEGQEDSKANLSTIKSWYNISLSNNCFLRVVAEGRGHNTGVPLSPPVSYNPVFTGSVH